MDSTPETETPQAAVTMDVAAINACLASIPHDCPMARQLRACLETLSDPELVQEVMAHKSSFAEIGTPHIDALLTDCGMDDGDTRRQFKIMLGRLACPGYDAWQVELWMIGSDIGRALVNLMMSTCDMRVVSWKDTLERFDAHNVVYDVSHDGKSTSFPDFTQWCSAVSKEPIVCGDKKLITPLAVHGFACIPSYSAMPQWCDVARPATRRIVAFELQEPSEATRARIRVCVDCPTQRVAWGAEFNTCCDMYLNMAANWQNRSFWYFAGGHVRRNMDKINQELTITRKVADPSNAAAATASPTVSPATASILASMATLAISSPSSP